MTEPVNNQWIDEILQVLHEDLGYIETGAYYDSDRQRLYDNRMQEAKQAITAKLESIEQEAKVDVWQEVDNLALGYRSYRMSDVAQERLRQLKGKG